MKKVYLRDLSAEEITKRLQNNDVVYYGIDAHYKFVNGILCKFVKGHCARINATIDMSSLTSFYFEEKEPLIIEAGKIYKTRDGSKAVCYKVNINEYHTSNYPFKFIIVGCGKTFSTTEYGKVYRFNDDETCWDIIEEWKD